MTFQKNKVEVGNKMEVRGFFTPSIVAVGFLSLFFSSCVPLHFFSSDLPLFSPSSVSLEEEEEEGREG